MSSDVTLDGELVVVQGSWMKVRTLDLMLDAPSRRQTQTGERRALVHDVGDSLAINYHGDYPNGVRIAGLTRAEMLHVEGRAGFAAGLTTPSIILGHPAQPATSTPGTPTGAGQWGLDVGAAISQLESRIADLEQRLSALEG